VTRKSKKKGKTYKVKVGSGGVESHGGSGGNLELGGHGRNVVMVFTMADIREAYIRVAEGEMMTPAMDSTIQLLEREYQKPARLVKS